MNFHRFGCVCACLVVTIVFFGQIRCVCVCVCVHSLEHLFAALFRQQNALNHCHMVFIGYRVVYSITVHSCWPLCNFFQQQFFFHVLILLLQQFSFYYFSNICVVVVNIFCADSCRSSPSQFLTIASNLKLFIPINAIAI